MQRLILQQYKQELKRELQNILYYWTDHTLDTNNGGFTGKIDSDNHVNHTAPKGSVLNARILWTFSAAYNQTPDNHVLDVANRAYQYFKDHFIDHEHGGVYWSVSPNGKPLDDKKQIYALAFAIYGLTEYFKASGNREAIDYALELYETIEERSFDVENEGYFEAFTREWDELADLRLSAKDDNEKKTMNTHLHVLEAYTNLYHHWPDENLKDQIARLIKNFIDHLVNKDTYHLILFSDEKWTPKSNAISFGHDIEAAWLLLEAAEAINNKHLIELVKDLGIKMTYAAANGLDTDGGLWYEYDPSKNHLVKEKHWWVQAEAMVGFFNAFELTTDADFLNKSYQTWEFVKSNLLDHVNGEWFWGLLPNGEIMPGEDKVGLWKCPYHNSRACIEIIKRISVYENNQLMEIESKHI